MYFYYGITHSTLENPEEEIELKVDQKTYVTPPTQTGEQTAVWDSHGHGYENRMAEEANGGWNGGGGYWNAGNNINQGWGAEPAANMAVPSYPTKNTGSGAASGNGSSSRKATDTKKGSSSASSKGGSKPKPPKPAPPPLSKKPAAKAPSTEPASVAQPTAPKKDGFGMFVEETQFPTWDD